MKLFYITAKSYPSKNADHIYIEQLVRALSQVRSFDVRLILMKLKSPLPGVNVDIVKKISYLPRTVSVAWYVYRLCREHRKDHTSKLLVLMTNDYNIGVVLVLCKKFLFSQVKIVFDAHLLSETWKDKLVLNNSSLIVCTSKVLETQVNAIITSVPVCTVWGGVDCNSFKKIKACELESLRNKHNLPKDKILVGYIGGFLSGGKEKGLRTLIDSLQHLDDRFHVLLVGGKGAIFEEYESYVKEQNLTERCTCIGWITHQEVSVWQSLCNILVIPYPDEPHFTKYGLPMKLFEYLATAKPVIYSNLKIMDDILAPYGYSFNSGNPRALAERVLEVVTTSANKKKPFDCERYSWDAKAQKIKTLLMQL